MTTQIRTRILNKYDLLANYNTFKPLKGEICIAEVTSATPSFDGTKPAPIVGIKVGDGVHTFAELPWIQAVAGDVVKEIKELTGIADIDAKIAALASGRKLATIAELNTLSEELASVKATINHAEHGNSALKSAIDTLSSNTATNLATKVDKSVAEEATSADKLVKSTTVDSKINTAKSELNTAIQGVQTNLNNLAGEGNQTTVKGNADAIAALDAKIGKVSYTGDSVTAAIAALQASIGDSSEGLGSQVTDLKTRMDEAETAIGTKAAQADLEALQGRVTTAEGKITTLEDKMDVVQAATAGYNAEKTISADIQIAKDAAESAQSKADTNEGKITTLIGNDADKSIRTIANEELAAQLLSGENGAVDNFSTLKELADWLEQHPEDAAAMNSAITSVKQNLGYTGDDLATAPATVDSRINALKQEILDKKYATEAALDETNSAVSALQSKVDTGDKNVSKYVEDYVAQELESYADTGALGTLAGEVESIKTNYATKTYAEEQASAAQTAAEKTATDAIAALAGEGNASTVKNNAEDIASINAAIDAMDYTDLDATTVGGVVTKVTQDNGKIAVTHKKITMDEFDPDATFIFYCGTASDVID